MTWVVVIRGVEADSDPQLRLAVARARTALRLPHSGTVTIREWLWDEYASEPPAQAGTDGNGGHPVVRHKRSSVHGRKVG